MLRNHYLIKQMKNNVLTTCYFHRLTSFAFFSQMTRQVGFSNTRREKQENG